MTRRENFTKAIDLLFHLGFWAVAWQAVRFCQGEIGAPIWDQLMDVLRSPHAAVEGPIAAPLAWLERAYYYVGGVTVWVGLATFVRGVGGNLSRIVEVGWTEFLHESKAASAERDRWAQVQADRGRRRDQRRKLDGAKRPRPAVSWGTLIVGIIIGRLL